MPGAGCAALVTLTATGVVVVPSAGNRVRAGVTSMARPDVVSVQAPDLQRKVGDPAWQGWLLQAASPQSTLPLQSLSTWSEQLVSVVAPTGLGVQEAAAVQVDGIVPEQVPVPPLAGVQARVAQPASAVQSARHTAASAPKVIETEAALPEWLALTVAVPAQTASVAASQVVRTSVADAPVTVAVLVPPGNVPRLVVTVTGPPAVSVTVSVSVLTPFATTAVFAAVMPT